MARRSLPLFLVVHHFLLLLLLASLAVLHDRSAVAASTDNCRATVLILGARKAGTTSLFHYLFAHPDFEPVLGGAVD